MNSYTNKGETTWRCNKCCKIKPLRLRPFNTSGSLLDTKHRALSVARDTLLKILFAVNLLQECLRLTFSYTIGCVHVKMNVEIMFVEKRSQCALRSINLCNMSLPFADSLPNAWRHPWTGTSMNLFRKQQLLSETRQEIVCQKKQMQQQTQKYGTDGARIDICL